MYGPVTKEIHLISSKTLVSMKETDFLLKQKREKYRVHVVKALRIRIMFAERSNEETHIFIGTKETGPVNIHSR